MTLRRKVGDGDGHAGFLPGEEALLRNRDEGPAGAHRDEKLQGSVLGEGNEVGGWLFTYDREVVLVWRYRYKTAPAAEEVHGFEFAPQYVHTVPEGYANAARVTNPLLDVLRSAAPIPRSNLDCGRAKGIRVVGTKGGAEHPCHAISKWQATHHPVRGHLRAAVDAKAVVVEDVAAGLESRPVRPSPGWRKRR